MQESFDYSQDAILDNARIGNQPSRHYLDNVDVLDNVIRDCMYVSKGYSDIRSPTSKHYYASVLFTALISRAVSLAQLIPYSPWAEKRIEHWDYSSAAGITRTMLEIRIAFYYLCVESCEAIEWECRWNLFNLHDCISRKHLFESMSDLTQVDGFESQATEIRERLNLNSFFQSLKPGVQKKLLNGQSAYLSSLEDIAERAGMEVAFFRWIYKFFSSHVHGLPMSFYRIGSGVEERGRGLPSPVEEGYTSLCMSCASSFLTSTRDNIHDLFSDFKAHAEAKIKEEIKSNEKIDFEKPPVGMAVGEKVILLDTDAIQIETTRKSEESFVVNYIHKEQDEIVLTRIISDGDENGLEHFDVLFWSVEINGKPATSSQMDKIETRPWAFRIDHESRKLHIKYDV